MGLLSLAMSIAFPEQKYPEIKDEDFQKLTSAIQSIINEPIEEFTCRHSSIEFSDTKVLLDYFKPDAGSDIEFVLKKIGKKLEKQTLADYASNMQMKQRNKINDIINVVQKFAPVQIFGEGFYILDEVIPNFKYLDKVNDFLDSIGIDLSIRFSPDKCAFVPQIKCCN